MSGKVNIGVVFGGRSVEHEVSVITGIQVLEALNRDKYEPIPLYLDQDNIWYTGNELFDISFFRQDLPPLNKLKKVYASPNPADGKLLLISTRTPAIRKTRNINIDCVIPATHGTFGEDGCLQGLLEMANVPYAGSNVAASVIGMDKIRTKEFLQSTGLPHLKFIVVTGNDYRKDRDLTCNRIERDLRYPVYIKPAILGSSIGISSAMNPEQLVEGLDLAVKFGSRVLVEQGLLNGREINCSVIDEDPPIPSILEEPVSSEDLLTFDEKYMGGKKGGSSGEGMAGQTRVIPAELDDSTASHIKNLAVEAFKGIGAGGVARIDFLLDSDMNVFINEINNIPGSLSFYLWENMGRSFSELLDKLIERAFEINKRQNRFTYNFETNLLSGGG